jgi:hypothetical protein
MIGAPWIERFTFSVPAGSNDLAALGLSGLPASKTDRTGRCVQDGNDGYRTPQNPSKVRRKLSSKLPSQGGKSPRGCKRLIAECQRARILCRQIACHKLNDAVSATVLVNTSATNE